MRFLVVTTIASTVIVSSVIACGDIIGIGDPIPDYDWRDLQSGERIRLAELRGEVVVLAYFATF